MPTWGAGRRLAARMGALFGGLGMPCRRLRFGGERKDAAVEARRGGVEIALAFARVIIEQSDAAKKHRNEQKRAP